METKERDGMRWRQKRGMGWDEMETEETDGMGCRQKRWMGWDVDRRERWDEMEAEEMDGMEWDGMDRGTKGKRIRKICCCRQSG